jgi:hypothetical protein
MFLGAAYICTEAAFPSNRLHELLNKINLDTKYPITNKLIFIEHVNNSVRISIHKHKFGFY